MRRKCWCFASTWLSFWKPDSGFVQFRFQDEYEIFTFVFHWSFYFLLASSSSGCYDHVMMCLGMMISSLGSWSRIPVSVRLAGASCIFYTRFLARVNCRTLPRLTDRFQSSAQGNIDFMLAPPDVTGQRGFVSKTLQVVSREYVIRK